MFSRFSRSETTFPDRQAAGQRLAEELAALAGRDDVVVLALPRGGVPVGYEIAVALGVPLQAFLVRKLGAPGNPELAVGAVASDGTTVLDQSVIGALGVSQAYVTDEIERQTEEIRRRLDVYGEGGAVEDLSEKTVILVDDGVATGSTVRAGLTALRQAGPRGIILAVPVGPPETLEELGQLADRVVAPVRPRSLMGVGMWYDRFDQVPDEEVVSLLASARSGSDTPPGEALQS